MTNKQKNVQIPTELFNALLDVLEYIDVSNYAPDFQAAFNSVLEGLQDKKKKMELREDYSRLITANKTGNENEQDGARIEYLKNRSWRSE